MPISTLPFQQADTMTSPAPNQTSKSVLVLGGSGFICSRLIAGLLDNNYFDVIDVAGRGAGKLMVAGRGKTVDGSISRQLLEQFSAPDIVVWTAGSASVGASIADPQHDFDNSIPPLDDLISLLVSSWTKTRLVFLSSAAVYGASLSTATATQTNLLPVSPYGQHKLLSERKILSARADLKNRSHIVRPFSVYGPGLRRQLFWDAAAKCKRNDFVFLGGGQELRDWVYVDDFVELIIDIAIQPTDFPRLLNAGSGYGISVEQAIRTLYKAMDINQLPEFSGQLRAGDPDKLVADADEQKAFSRYFVTPLETGLRHYVDWYSGIHKT